MTTLVFKKVTDGSVMGKVSIDGDKVEADPWMQDMVDSWLKKGEPLSTFIPAHTGSNGYWTGTVV